MTAQIIDLAARRSGRAIAQAKADRKRAYADAIAVLIDDELTIDEAMSLVIAGPESAAYRRAYAECLTGYYNEEL